MTRCVRAILLALGLTFGLGLPASGPAQAQGPAPGGPQVQAEGRPIAGYIAAGVGCGLIIFVISISARR